MTGRSLRRLHRAEMLRSGGLTRVELEEKMRTYRLAREEDGSVSKDEFGRPIYTECVVPRTRLTQTKRYVPLRQWLRENADTKVAARAWTKRKRLRNRPAGN